MLFLYMLILHRWTSQILAEIDSLPSSSFDLTGHSTPQPSSPFISTANSVITTDTNVAFLDEVKKCSFEGTRFLYLYILFNN